jgi:hypothetical protein
MLSFSKGNPIAEILPSGTIVKVTDEILTEPDLSTPNGHKLLQTSFFRKYGCRPGEIEAVRLAIGGANDKGLSQAGRAAYDAADEEIDNIMKKEMYIPPGEGKIEFVWPKQENKRGIEQDGWAHMFVTGGTGSGKSYYIKNLIKKITPQRPIYVLTPLTDGDYRDPELPTVQHIVIDEDLVSNQLNLLEFVQPNDGHAIFIFDDIESIRNPQIRESVKSFRDQVLETGRHYNLSAIVVHHVAQAGLQTKHIINECTYYVLFPRSNAEAVNKFLVSKVGIGKEMQERVKKLETRSLTVKRDYPVVFVSDQNIICL